MKQIFGLFFVTLFLTFGFCIQDGFSQKYKKPKPFVIDFEKKMITKYPEKLKEGDFYYLKVKKINMNLYTITIDNKDTVITSEVSFPTFEIVGSNIIKELVADSSPLSYSMISPSTSNEILNMPFFHGIENLPSDEQEEIVDEYLESIIDSLGDFDTYLDSKSQEIQDSAREIDALSLEIQTLALSYIVERDKILKKDLENDLDFREAYQQSGKYRKSFTQIIEDLKGEQKKYQDFYQSNKEVIDKSDDLKKKHAEIVERFTSLISAVNKLFNAIGAEKINDWITSIIHLDNNKDRYYTSLPIQLNGDFTDLSIKIEPKDKKFGLPSYHTKYRFPDPPQWQIGLSSGFYFSDLTDNAYSISATKLDSVSAEISVVNENPSKWETGTALLFHWNLSNFLAEGISNQNLQIHFSVGPGISFTNPVKPRVLLGGGFAIGGKHKLSLNVLAVYGSVDRLSNLYSVSDTKIVGIEEIPESVTGTKYRRGLGFSVGYIYKF